LQAAPEKIIAHCGQELGERLIAAGHRSREHVRNLVQKLPLDCDVRNDYLWVERDGTQSIVSGEDFALDPYPYILGMAQAVRENGVDIFEQTFVRNIECHDNLCRIYTNRGVVDASYVIAAGGCRLAETVPELAHLRNRTVELYVTTLRTEPLSEEVLRS